MAEMSAEKGSLAYNLGSLLESGEGADVTLEAGDSQLPAHSQILAARSPVFTAMLKHDMREASCRRIEIADMREAVLKQLLWFIYTDTAGQLDDTAAELLAASDRYDVPMLKKRCEQKMAKDLNVDNAGAAAILAELHSCPLLRNDAVDFIRTHPEVMSTDGWIDGMRSNVEAAAQICRQLSTPPSSSSPSSSSPSPANRFLSEEHKQKLCKRLLDAAAEGQAKEVWALLDAGAPVDVKDQYEDTTLHVAVRKSCAPAVKYLIDAGADVNARNKYQRTPLHIAVCQSDVQIIWVLLAASADIDAQDKDGNTPLHLAGPGYTEQTKALLLAGARREIKNVNGRIPKDISCDRQLFDTY